MAFLNGLTIEFSSGIPVYKQIMNFIYAGIGKASLREGDRLPTIKELTERLGVNPNTVAKAYHELDLRGVLTSRRGNGSFVSAFTGKTARLTARERQMKLDELLGRIIAEANGFGITEKELLQHIAERMKENE